MSRNLALVVPNLHINGTSALAILLAQRLLSADWKPHFICVHEEGELSDLVKNSQHPLHCLGIPQADRFRVCQAVKKTCQEWNIQLLQSHLAPFDLRAVRGGQKANLTALLSYRRTFLSDSQIKSLNLQKSANSRVALSIFSSQALCQEICQTEKIPEEKSRVIYPGFPEEKIPNHPLIEDNLPKSTYLRGYQLRDDELALACISDFRPEKNHKRLFEAVWKINLEAVKQFQVRLILIGDGPERPSLERYVEEKGFRNMVVFLGSRRDRLKILSECDALVVPPLKESLPLPLLEAMALGIPVAASKTGGIPELLEHGKSGYLFNPENISEMSRCLWDLLTQRPASIQLARNAQNTIRQNFTAHRMLRAHLEIYDQLVPR